LPHAFRIQAVTRKDRHLVLRQIEQAIHGSGGWFTDFRQFSNFAYVFELEAPRAAIERLFAAISQLEIGSSMPPAATIEGVNPAGELSGTLRVEFVHDDPVERVEVPLVPG